MEQTAAIAKKQKLGDHVRELRKRFVISTLSLLLASGAVYFIYEPILNFLRAPLGQPLYYDTPTGGLAFVMKLCVIGGLLIAMPVLAYNIVMFIRPAFVDKISMKKIALISITSGLLALGGTAFGYYIVLKGSLHFFSDFQVSGLHALISADNYLNFVTNVILTFVVMFQIPVVVGFINRIRPIRPRTMLKGEKWIIIGSLAIAAIVPFAYDLATSLLIALPIIALYNIAFLFVLVSRLRSPLPAIEKMPVVQTQAVEAKTVKRFVKRSQLEEAMEPLDWLDTQKIAAPEFNGSYADTKMGVMEIKSRTQKPAVQVPDWHIERQRRRQTGYISEFNKIPPGTKLVSI